MEWHLSNKEHTYILRYYLPCLPQYKEEVTIRRGDDLISYCQNHHIGAVMFYVDLNPHWYYMPDTEEHNRYVCEVIVPLAQKLKNAGISYQLNYQNLFGAWDGNYDHRDILKWECYVDEFGEPSYGSGCMIGEKFRKTAGEKLRLWSQTKPDVIWIDDDMRFHNHRTEIHGFWNGDLSCENLDFGCFCETHIDKFNQKYKTNLKREEIVSNCLKPPKNTDMRAKWLKFQSECYEDAAKWICKIVNNESPDTRVAIMTSVPDVHAVEGRNWDTFLSGLSGDKTPLIRATIGPYAEGNPRDFSVSHSLLERLKTNIQSQYKGTVDYCPEIENTRFTRYSKSIMATKYQIGLSAFSGCRGTTLSIYDLEGCILEEEAEFGEMLDEIKPFCDMMNAEKMCDYKNKGISFISSPDRIGKYDHDNDLSRFSDMISPHKLDMLFTKVGIPIDYCTPENIKDNSAFILDRFSVLLLNNEEIKNILKKNVFLDAGAAKEIIKKGFCSLIGVSELKKNKCVVSSEILHTEKRTDGSDVIVPSRISGNRWFEATLSGAGVLSSFVIPSGERYPGLVRFQNPLGGQVFIYCAENDFGDAFYSNYRIKLLKKICNDICPDIITVDFNAYGSVAVRKLEDKTAVFVANLSADSIDNLTMSIPKTAKSARLITSAGETKQIEFKDDKICLDGKMHIYDFGVILFS